MNHCGSCKACCTLMAVEEIKKPRCVTCQHVVAAGCGIYEARPLSCQAFECVWLGTQSRQQPWPKRLRPDRCGIMFVPTTDPNVLTAHGNPELLRMKPLAGRVTAWLSNGLRIISAHGEKRTMIFWKKT